MGAPKQLARPTPQEGSMEVPSRATDRAPCSQGRSPLIWEEHRGHSQEGRPSGWGSGPQGGRWEPSQPAPPPGPPTSPVIIFLTW